MYANVQYVLRITGTVGTYTWTLATFDGFEGKLLLTNETSDLQQQ